MTPASSALSHALRRARLAGVALAVAMSCALPVSGFTAPGIPDQGQAAIRAQNVDYIGAASGARLDVGMPVLVPGWVPAPFGGEPSIDVGGGYYSLYWMNGGGNPTFLQVEGAAGAGLPAGSPYDLNIELSINASVRGYGAIHDVTPNYDAVWWIEGGVRYKVESRNSSVDSLSLANSLITFVPPAAPEPEPEPTPVPQPEPTSPPLSQNPDPDLAPPAEGGSEDGDVVDEPAPAVDAPSEEDAGQSGAEPDDAGTSNGSDGTGAEAPTTSSIGSDGTGQPFVMSDGTGGASVRVIGSDGTGGTREVVVVPARNGEPAP